MADKICREAAEEEVQGWCETFGATPDLDSREKLVQSLMSGRIMFDVDSGAFTIQLRKPIQLENGKTIDSLKIDEPDFDQLGKATKTKNEVEQAKFLISYITGHGVGVIGRLKARDLALCGSVLDFFG